MTMPPEIILLWLRRMPFQAFRVHILEKSFIDVRLPELVVTGLATLDYFEIVKEGVDPEIVHTMTVAFRHISRLEKLRTAPKEKG
jgi:hypothetical protein